MALREMGDNAANSRVLPYTNKHKLTRGDRSRGSVDGYRHREEVFKPLLVPWIKQLEKDGRHPVLLEDGAPAHKSRIATVFLEVSWPGHGPDVNAKEHALPWIRHRLTKDFTPSTCADEYCKQWAHKWEQVPRKAINKEIDGIPDVVRDIIKHHGENYIRDGEG